MFYSVSDGDYVLICSTVSVGDYRMAWCFISVCDGDYVLICSTVTVGDYRMVWCFIACLMVIMF